MKQPISSEVRSNFLLRTRGQFVVRLSAAPIAATLLAAALCFMAPAARADSCSTSTTGPFNWNDSLSWACSGPNGSIYPGEKGADTASMCVVSAGATANVIAATPFPVTVSVGVCSGGSLNINTNGSLTIAPTSVVNGVNVSGGTLIVGAGGSSTANGNVLLNIGTITLNGGLDIPGPGTFSFNGGTLNGAGVLTVLSAAALFITGSAGPMTLSGARIDSLAPVTYTSANTLAINDGAKLRIISSALAMNGTGAITTNAPALSSLEIEASATLTANTNPTRIQAPLNTQSGTTIIANPNSNLQMTGGGNHWAAFNAASNSSMLFSGIHNFGGSTTFTSAAIPPAFEFTGAASQFNITQSQVTIPGLKWTGGTIGGGQTLVLTAANIFGEFTSSAWAIGSGTTVQLSSGSVSLGTATTINGPGLLRLGPVAVTVNGSPNVINAPVTISGPTFTFGTSGQIDFSGGGAITGGTFATTLMTETFRFGGPFLVHAGTFQGPGGFVVQAGGTFTIDGINGPIAFVGTPGSSRLFLLGGTMIFRDAVSSVDMSGFQIRIDSPGIMDLQNDTSLTTTVSAATISNNGGTFQKSGGSLTSSIAPSFSNDGGTVMARSGKLDFTNGYTQTGGTTILGAGNIAVAGGSGTLLLNSGTLSGSGTIEGSLMNNAGATVAPGSDSPLSTGIINVSDLYLQNGILRVKLGGTAPGSGYDVLSTGGTEVLGGALLVSYVPPFTSPSAQAYNVYTSTGPRIGTFTFTNFPAPSAAWRTNYLPNSVQIVMTQADVSVTKTAPASVRNGQDIVFTITVTNNDPTATATNISVGDTASGPATYGGVTASSGVMCLGPPIAPPPALPPPPGVSCTIATLAPGATATITLTGTTTGTGTVTNSVTASGAEYDPNTSNNSASVAVTVNPAVDLALTIGDAPDPVLAGTNVTYTVTVANSGLDASAAGSLALTLTGGTIASTSGSFTCSSTATTVNCTSMVIPASGSATMTIVATAGSGASMSLSGSISDPNETNPPNNTDSQSTTINASADLAVAQSASPTTIFNGQSSVITVTVTNNGPSAATAIPLTDSVTGPVTITSASTAAGTCIVSGLTVNCTINSLPSGASATVTISIAASGIGTITSSPSIPSAAPPLAQIDPNSANNTGAPVSITVNAASDLSMVITPPAVVNAGQNCTFSALISNAGPDTAASFTASFTITGGTILSAGSPVICTTTGTTATCTGSGLAAGATAMVTIVASAGPSGSIALTGTLSAASDPNGANNTTSSGAVVISPTADVGVSQSGPASTYQGQNTTIVVTVTNVGPSGVTNVTLTDTFTNGALVSATATQGTCSGTGPVTCLLGALASGGSATITIVLTPTGVSPLTNSGSVSAAEFDPATSNNTLAPLAIAVGPSADVSVSQTGPSSVAAGLDLSLIIVVTNNGPSVATNVALSDSFTGATLGSFTTNHGTCSGSPTVTCAIGTLPSGATAVITLVLRTEQAMIQNSAMVSASEHDPALSNNSSTFDLTTTPEADVSVTKSGPGSASPGTNVDYTITITNRGPSAATHIRVEDPTPAGLAPLSVSGACTTLPCTIPSLSAAASTTIAATFTVTAGVSAQSEITNTVSVTARDDPNSSNDSSSVTTRISCTTQPPTLISPLGGVVSSPVMFSWSAVAKATMYEVFVAQGDTHSLGTTPGTSLTASVGNGAFSWYVIATTSDCGSLRSASASVNACNQPEAPLASVVANAASGQSYVVEWPGVADTALYEIQEAGDADFTAAATTSITDTSVGFTHSTTTTVQPFFYRVRGIAECNPDLKGPWSITIRVVIAPIPTQNVNPNATVPAGSRLVVVQDVPIPGIDDGTSYSFTASVDRPWLWVTPSAGILPPAGIVLQISADPTSLDNGTFTGTLIVTISPVAASALQANSTTTVTLPISVNLVTPVTPTAPKTAPPNTLIIPSVGHLDGLNSLWQSDVRVANTGSSRQQFLLTFTPTSNQAGIATTGVKQTTVTIDGGSTVALDDIARNWFGIGSLGEAANGVLMIRALQSTSITPTVSSRTYSVSSTGTLGQYIPAIPFSSFISAAVGNALQSVLSLQQIEQSDAYRTNLGLVEAGGAQAAVTVSVFNAAGTKIRDIPLTVEAFQQLQLNAFLAAQGLSLEDGRIEVKVTGGSGKVTAYASVVDNRTSDPLLVTGVPLTQPLATRYVLPGVANLDNGLASWRSDVRIFNAGTAPHSATLTLHPLGGGEPLTASQLLNPGQIKLLDDAVKALFGATNVGGALHISTPDGANLIVTGRTYNAVTGGGTFGQFIPAVTPADAVGAGDRALQILQVEDSARYRTNLGIAEVTGQAATAEIMIHLPDSKATPVIKVPLGAYEYRQIPVIQQLGLGNVYNVRVSVRVTGGSGKVTAYGSVIDQQTQDPTYVPAQ